ncbi:hypothetical protein BGZ83_004739 [Gryganskiella cystojenkinii]|nr:hypothetical protein BGZ83_004739 [Gryganskiella cystojenkinii]
MEIFASELLCLIRSSRSGYIDEPLVKINSDGRPPHLLFYAANDYSEIWKNVTHGYFALREQLQDLAIQEAKNNNNPSKLVAVDSQPSLTPSIPSSSTSLTCSCCTLHNKMMFPPTAKAMTMTTAASDSGEYGTETVVVTTTITTPKKTTGTKEHRATVKEQPNRGGGRGSLAGPMTSRFKTIQPSGSFSRPLHAQTYDYQESIPDSLWIYYDDEIRKFLSDVKRVRSAIQEQLAVLSQIDH